MPGTVLGTESKAVSKTEPLPLWELAFHLGRQVMNKYIISV